MTHLTRLRLTDFRNYETLDLALDGRHVCLHGPNGAGKTNLLEAISQLGPGRGLRSAAIQELTRKQVSGGWTVAATWDERQIGVALEETDRGGWRRTVRVDSAPATATDLADHFRIFWITPAMDRIFAGGASDRRRFFDRQVMTHIPAHGRLASAYEKAMRERNALLERGAVDPAWADAIEARMSEAGAGIMLNRAMVLEQLRAAIEAREDGHFPKADIELTGGGLDELDPAGDADSIKYALADIFQESRWKDKAAGRTLVGPHRVDLAVIHRPTGAPAREASTGQQKALLIGLVLASVSALAGEATPLVLLDEAAAHLDADRRAALYDALCALGGQSWLTGTEGTLFEAFGERAQHISVSDGAVTVSQ